MTRLPFFKPTPRRALVGSASSVRTHWLQHGLAALAVSVLGLGVAGSMALTGAASSIAAQPTPAPSVVRTVEPGVTLPDAFDGVTADRPSRSVQRSALSAALSAATLSKAVADRADALETAAAAADEQADKLAEKKRKAKKAAEAAAKRGCVPVAAGYTVGSGFGEVGAWARYHTGLDLSAPMGTRLRAPAAGTVKVAGAGTGPASGWAGIYVVIELADGTNVLLAHMSSVSVRVGQKVDPCDTVGAVGLTGRTFGPHLHFEVYPPGVEPGDVYRTVDPLPWLTTMGAKP